MSSTSESDYFDNHRRAHTFPWSLYHLPIENDLGRFFDTLGRDRAGLRVLVIGAGFLHELDRLPPGAKLTVADIDQRALDVLASKPDPRIEELLLISPEGPEAGSGYDAVYAKEVIEHILDPIAYLERVKAALKPSGKVWLSTPNYGEPWLPLVERTFLELVARLSGYSRRDIHPTKFSRQRLESTLKQAGFRDVEVKPVAYHLALTASARA